MSAPAWNSLEIAKFVASMATPVVVALIGLWITSRLKAKDRKFEAAYQSERRLNTPHIELHLDCNFLGVRDGIHLATFTVAAKNVGQVLHKFTGITLRIRGIKDEPFEYRVGTNDANVNPYDKYRVRFPHLLLKTDLVPKSSDPNKHWNFIFVEPGVTQRLPLTTCVPVEFRYLLVHVIFSYEKYTPHTAEAVFAVPTSRDDGGHVDDLGAAGDSLTTASPATLGGGRRDL